MNSVCSQNSALFRFLIMRNSTVGKNPVWAGVFKEFVCTDSDAIWVQKF
jgi:hypothetical protein